MRDTCVTTVGSGISLAPMSHIHLYQLLSLTADIPFEKAVAGVRVGWINGKPVVNPTVSACLCVCVFVWLLPGDTATLALNQSTHTCITQ